MFQTDPNDPNGPDLDTKIEEMKLNIRRSETTKMKAEARIECLRTGGVNVDEWLQEAETLNVQDIQRSTSSLSMRTDASGTGVSTKAIIAIIQAAISLHQIFVIILIWVFQAHFHFYLFCDTFSANGRH